MSDALEKATDPQKLAAAHTNIQHAFVLMLLIRPDYV